VPDECAFPAPQAALQHLIISYQRQLQSSNVPDLLQKQGLPALKVSVVPVSSHALVPKPPAAELAEIGKTVRMGYCRWQGHLDAGV
jgi:hypothetical protein